MISQADIYGAKILIVDDQEVNLRLDLRRDQFAVGSDPRGATIKAYDAASLLPGVANRISYVIGQDGKVVFTHQGSDPIRHVDETLKAVRDLASARR